MGTTAQKLQKLIDNKQLIIDKVNSKAGTSFDINSKLSDVANAIENIQGGGGIPEGYIKPSGNKEITSNGDYDITEFASVSVNVPTTGGSAGGTAVPNSGYVEKVYLNTSLSKEEVMSIIESANLTYTDNTYTIFLSSDYSSTLLITINSFGVYHIWFGEDILWSDANGWNDFVNPLVINKENILSSMGFGTQNELIKDIISTTPFSGSCEPTGLPLEVDSLPSAGVEGAIYKTPRKFTDVYIYVDDFTYGKLSSSYSVIGSEEVEVKPTSNIVSSTMESFYLYYVTSENDIFAYIDIGYGLMWVNVSMMTELVYGEALPFKGECEKGDEPTDIGYYAYFVPEYLYQVKDSQLQELKYKPKKIEISPGGVEETFKPLKGEYFSEVKLTAGDYITPNKIHRSYTILGVKGTCIPVEDFFHNMSFDKIEMNGVILKENMFYQKRVNEIEIKAEAYYSSASYCPLPPSVFASCEATKIVLRGDYILKPYWTTKQGYDKDGNLVTIYNKLHAFIGCSNLTTLVLDFPDFAPVSLNQYADFAADLFKNTPIANGTGYIYVPDNKVDYVKTLAGYDQVASQIRPLSAYTE